MTTWWSIRTPWQECVQIDEFGGGSNDACGPYALENLRANYLKRAPEYGGGGSIRGRMIQHGWFTPGTGCTLQGLKAECALEAPGNVGPVLDFHDWQDTTLTADQVHAALAHHVGVIFEVHNAAALTANEPGVQNHFVVAAAYDPTGDGTLYILNSDYAANVRAHGPQTGQWIKMADFLKADPRGYIVIAPPVTATPPPPPVPVPPPAPAPAPVPVLTTRYHTVVNGDSLPSLAQLYYGDKDLWAVIYDVPANKRVIGSNPDMLHINQVLEIPWLVVA